MTKTAINLYSVRELDVPMLDLLDRVAEAGYDGVQFSGGFRDATAEAAAARVREHGLGVVPAHADTDRLESEQEAVLEEYRDTLGCAGVVVPWLGPEAFESAETVDETARRLSTLADDFASRGLALHYHNHAHEFAEVDGELAFERLLRRTDDLRIELDVGWALVGGVDPAAWIDDHGDRIDVLHAKDVDADAEAFTEIGAGDVDMEACAAAVRDAGVEWLVYEHDEPEDPAASIATGAEFLAKL